MFETVKQEVELAVIIGKTCRNVDEADAMDYVGGYCLAQDLSGTSFIASAIKTSRPWDLGKAFDTATPVSRFISPEELPNPHDVQLVCRVNGELKQQQSTADLLFDVRSIGGGGLKWKDRFKINSSYIFRFLS